MMRLAKWSAPLALVCTLLLPTLTQARADTSHEELYQRSGLDQQLRFLWREISSEYVGLPKKVTHHLFEQSINSIIKTEFSEPRVREVILQKWAKDLSDEDISKISEWLDSPIGRNLTTAEISASTASDESELALYLTSLRQHPPSRKRIELLRLLDKAVYASEAATDIGIQINLAAVTALHYSGFAASNAKTPVDQTELHERDRSLIRAIMKQDVLRYNLFMYRALEDETLRAYIEFAESPAGARYHESTFLATRAALAKATVELQNQIQGLMPEANVTAQLATD